MAPKTDQLVVQGINGEAQSLRWILQPLMRSIPQGETDTQVNHPFGRSRPVHPFEGANSDTVQTGSKLASKSRFEVKTAKAKAVIS